jgi:hypothetical protein
MDANKIRVITFAIIIAILVGVYAMTRPKMIPVVAVEPPTTQTNTATLQATSPKQACYYNTINDIQNARDTISQFVSINYSGANTVTGVSNWIPTGRDSAVGDYTGTINKSTIDTSYPSKMDILYTAMGDGVTVKQQEVFLVGPAGIKQATGEKVEGADHIYHFKDMTKLSYTNDPIPAVDCSTVPATISKDYVAKQ